ncbi:MAG: hypothetical protein LBN05_07035 [Oscillospiraceae bacterium]|jgi:hypothetical protein|nr:hypothetical protein [Oscillospiraceae bacterium]
MRFWKARKGKVLLVAFALALSSVLSVGSTAAWRDYSQHKTNEALGAGEDYGARLIEDYEPIHDWTVADGPQKKEIRVKNVGDPVGTFGAVYVRLQLKEFMEIAPVTVQKTPERYVVDTNGAFVTFATQDAAQAAYPDHETRQLTDVLSGQSGWFVQTQQGDENGQYGDFVPLSVQVGAPVPVIAGSVRANNPAGSHHSATQDSEECLYPLHRWDGTQLATRDYISWQLDSHVLTLTQWLQDPKPAAVWILDDRAEGDAWVYWGQALQPGETTADFLKSITLTTQPDGGFYYAIHTELDTVSRGELTRWTNAPTPLLAVL